jgi:hypothetical protein
MHVFGVDEHELVPHVSSLKLHVQLFVIEILWTITLQIGILHAHVPHLGRPPSFMPTSHRRWFCPRGSGVEAWLDRPREDSDQEALPAAIAGVQGYDVIGGRLLQIRGRALQIGSPYRLRVDESAPNLASCRSDRSRRRCSLQERLG